MKLARQTQIGNILIEEENGFITRLELSVDNKELDRNRDSSTLLEKAFDELYEYLAGNLKKFTLPLKPSGTEFQRKVWSELLKIPYGKTATYKDIAIRTGNSRAVRAVGMANNKNPIAIMIPCHRVIGSNGKLVGYAGGVDLKQKLLNMEAGFLM
jgi:methylated-DNA-[protein]-cysteine S-methyltransferase